MALVFQYGSNMSAARLNAGNRLNGAAHPVGVAVTENDYEFTFDICSKTNDCAAADIVEGGGRRIWGVLYEILDRLIRRDTSAPDKSLDAIEGEGTNYQRVEIHLRWPDGRCVAGCVLTYVGLARRQGIQTSAAYARHIVAGLAEHPAVPQDYVSYVRARILANNPALAPVVLGQQ
ncbi:MAG: gamma-glutamylcyclotransferase family protein [Verrucomicrobiota bacterium]|jgi:hypothetical protein